MEPESEGDTGPEPVAANNAGVRKSGDAEV